MNSKFLKFGLVAALALCMASCDDDSDTDEGGNGGKTPASTSCTVGQAGVCDGNDVRVCINGIWQTTNCPYGCANGVCQPKPADDPGTSTNVCTAGALQCSGNDLQVCSNNTWTKKETCKNGCDAAKKACKPDSTTEPQTGDSYCDGQILHYTDSNGKDKTEDCAQGASQGIECQTLKDGDSTCVFNHNAVKDVCAKEGDLAGGMCTQVKSFYAVDAVRCLPNDKGELVGVMELAVSVCGTYQGDTVTMLCEYDEEEDKMKPSLYKCGVCTENEYVATCDGVEVVPAGEAADEYVVCDDNCLVDEKGTTCAAACKADGYDYCYANYATKDVQCSKQEIDPGTLSDDPYYCGDERFKVDGVETTGTEYCNDESLVAICDAESVYCLAKCTAKNEILSGCEVDSDGVSYEYTGTCVDFDGHPALIVTDDKDCATTCNDDNSACK